MEKIPIENKVEIEDQIDKEKFDFYKDLVSAGYKKFGRLDFYNQIVEFVDELSNKFSIDTVREAYLFHALVGSTLSDSDFKKINRLNNNPVNLAIAEFLENN